MDATVWPDENPTVPSIVSIPPCTAIIVAAGSSRRMGFDKLSAPLGGVPVLRRTLDAFLAADCISFIIIVCPEERWELLGDEPFRKPVIRVDGGKNRQDSVAQGLTALPSGTSLVAVHDGARPLVHPDDITRCVAEASGACQAATLARRVTETMKRSDTEGFCIDSVSRENLWFMETPQVFSSALLFHAYEYVMERNIAITDEVSAAQAANAQGKFVESTHPNLKITTPADLSLAEALLR